jgi:low temperature requirement protein LtrA
VGFLFLYVLISGQAKVLFSRNAWQYARYCVAAKSIDALVSFFWCAGIVLTTVAQMASMEIFFPILVLIVATVGQRCFKLELGETLHGHALVRKSFAACLLALSATFV